MRWNDQTSAYKSRLMENQLIFESYIEKKNIKCYGNEKVKMNDHEMAPEFNTDYNNEF